MRACYERAVQLDETHAAFWYNVGFCGGCTLLGRVYNAKECFEKAVELGDKFAEAWEALGNVGGGIVSGKEYSIKDCFEMMGDIYDERPTEHLLAASGCVTAYGVALFSTVLAKRHRFHCNRRLMCNAVMNLFRAFWSLGFARVWGGSDLSCGTADKLVRIPTTLAWLSTCSFLDSRMSWMLWFASLSLCRPLYAYVGFRGGLQQKLALVLSHEFYFKSAAVPPNTLKYAWP
eukprot:1436242-Amphidinium_carterae.1